MKNLFFLLVILTLVSLVVAFAQQDFEEDVFDTSQGQLKITFIGHGTLMFMFGDKIIHVDPVGREADYSQFPKADIILITHEHGDHLDPQAIATLRTDNTDIVLTEKCTEKVEGGIIMANGMLSNGPADISAMTLRWLKRN